eukprot:scaffold8878_cov27-Tisochrysis_lutea.AAC.2
MQSETRRCHAQEATAGSWQLQSPPVLHPSDGLLVQIHCSELRGKCLVSVRDLARAEIAHGVRARRDYTVASREKALDADRAAGVDARCGYADLCAQTKAVSERESAYAEMSTGSHRLA